MFKISLHMKKKRQDISQVLKRAEGGGREKKNEVLLNIINKSQSACHWWRWPGAAG